MKNVIFTDHASERAQQRKIFTDTVVGTIASPDFVVQRGEEREAFKKVQDKLLKVVYTEKESFIIVITLYWVNGNETKDHI